MTPVEMDQVNLEQERQQEIMSAFEKGARLYQLTVNDGYKDLLDLLEAEVIEYEFRLMNLPPGTDAQLLRDTHSHARVARSIFEQIQIRIQAAVQLAVDAQTVAQQSQQQAQYHGL
jgi:hypothetical protein